MIAAAFKESVEHLRSPELRVADNGPGFAMS
jgi:hypothetical protein